eukprot:2511422-Pyramimonas_sp.AAC.1
MDEGGGPELHGCVPGCSGKSQLLGPRRLRAGRSRRGLQEAPRDRDQAWAREHARHDGLHHAR